MNPQQNADSVQPVVAQSMTQNSIPSPFAPPAMPNSQHADTPQKAATNPTDPLAVLKLPSNVAVNDGGPSPTASASNMISADDGDLIEKEWVDKAKQIVEHYHDDPYNQSKQMTIFRADYMKKRYNRTIKLGE